MTELAARVEVDGEALAFTQRALAEEKLAAFALHLTTETSPI